MGDRLEGPPRRNGGILSGNRKPFCLTDNMSTNVRSDLFLFSLEVFFFLTLIIFPSIIISSVNTSIVNLSIRCLF